MEINLDISPKYISTQLARLFSSYDKPEGNIKTQNRKKSKQWVKPDSTAPFSCVFATLLHIYYLWTHGLWFNHEQCDFAVYEPHPDGD